MRALISAALVFVFAGLMVVFNFQKKTALPVAPRDATESGAPAESAVSAPATRLPIELIGTIIRTQGSFATLRVLPGERENVFEGGAIQALADVTRIERERVTFFNRASGQEESVRIRPFDPALAVSMKAMDAPGSQKEFNVSRVKVDQQLQNLSQLLMTARAVPVSDSSGRMIGFRIESMDESSFFKDLGLKPGDLLTEVNGTQLESVEGVVQLFNELRNSSMILLRVSRHSQDLQLTYLIR